MKRFTWIMVMLLLVQSVAGIGFATTETGEYSEYVEETRENLTNMKALQTLIGYFGVDYFSIATSENADQSSAKNRIQEMINNPNAVMTNYDLISLMSEMVDVEERVVQMEESKGTVTNATVSNSSLINFLKLGYLDDTEAFSPSSHANAESMQMLLDNMLGYVVRTEEDLKQIPSDVKTITIVGSGINIEDMTLDADILITSKAKEGISFKNSTISGMIEISGGTETSPVSVEGTSVNKIIMAKSAYETSVSIGAGSSVESLKSKMDTSIVVEKGAQVDTVWSEGNTVLKTESGAVVSSLIANADTKVVGDNVIKNIVQNSNDVTVDNQSRQSAAVPSEVKNSGTIGTSSGNSGGGSSKKHSSNSSSRNNLDGNTDSEAVKGPATPVSSILVDSDSKFEVSFIDGCGKIDQLTAENVENYVIQGIGYPITATLIDSTVMLDYSNHSENILPNTEYKLEIYNVDNEKHILNEHVSIEFLYISDKMDTEKPYVISYTHERQGMLQIQFSETMEVSEGACLEYRNIADNSDTGMISAGQAYLSYVTFDTSELEDRAGVYEIIGFKNVTDITGNSVINTDKIIRFETSGDYDAEASKMGYTASCQIDGTTAEITYKEKIHVTTQNVELENTRTGNMLKFLVKSFKNCLVLEYIPDNTYELKVGDILEVDPSNFVQDLNGKAAKSETVQITWSLEDVTQPSIEYIHAINKYQVLVKYDEPILNMGTYKITDLNGNEFSDYLVLCGDEEDEVLIQIDATKPFSSDVTYYLIQNEKAQDESLTPAADAGTVQFLGSDVEYRFKSYHGNTLINGTTFTFTNSAGQPDGLYTVTSGSAVNADLLVAFEIEDGKVIKTSGNALENIKIVENRIVVELDDMYALLDHQKYDCTIKMKQPSFYYDYNGNINGIVERLDIEAATLSSITFDDLEYDEDFEIVLIVNGESHVVTESMIVYETISYNFSSGDRIMVIVLDKDTKNVYSRSETYIIK